MCHLRISVSFKWFVSETPYLIHEASKAPRITGCGVLLVVDSLREIVTSMLTEFIAKKKSYVMRFATAVLAGFQEQ